eukprot:4943938-Prorocentrum_lima.AAC.1
MCAPSLLPLPNGQQTVDVELQYAFLIVSACLVQIYEVLPNLQITSVISVLPWHTHYTSFS